MMRDVPAPMPASTGMAAPTVPGSIGTGAPVVPGASAPVGMPPTPTISVPPIEQQQTVIEIPNGPEVNYLIGSKGAGINALQDATGTRIQIQRTHEVTPGASVRSVTIWGGESQRQHCAQLVQAKVTECQQRDQARAQGGDVPGGPVGMIGNPQEQTVIEIPNGPAVNYLIGSKGAGINALQDATGTRIQIQRTHEVPAFAMVRTVTIWGGEAQRQHCAQLVQSKVLECQQRDQARGYSGPAGGGQQSGYVDQSKMQGQQMQMQQAQMQQAQMQQAQQQAQMQQAQAQAQAMSGDPNGQMAFRG